MAEWKQIGTSTIDLGRVGGHVDSVKDVLGVTAGLLKTVSAALELVTVLFEDGPNLVEQAVGAAVNTVEQSILDILQNNVAFAVHINMNWNPDWKYRRDGYDSAKLVPDYYNDGVTPMVGTGIDGWLLDVAYSTSDPSDPFRPLTDSDTSVQGVMFIKGVPAGGELSNLQSLFDLFSDFQEFDQALKMEENLKNATAGYEALLRMGPMALSPIMQEVSKPLEEIAQDAAGTLIGSGYAGLNEADSSLFTDSDTGGFVDVQLRDVLRTSNSPQFYEVIEIIDPSNIRVDPPIGKDNSAGSEFWTIRRGGLSSIIASLPQDLQEFTPTPGAYPMWASVPAAHLLPKRHG